jgi:hypothetical protein
MGTTMCECDLPWYLAGVLNHGWWIGAVVAIVIATNSKFLRFTAIRLLVLGIICGMVVDVFFELFNRPAAKMSLDQVLAGLIAYGTALYAALWEILRTGYAETLTKQRGEKWVKELDYPYLFLGAIGLVVSLNRLDVVSTHISRIEIVGPVIVTTAVVFRLLKTRVEIVGLNKKVPAKPEDASGAS